MPQLIGTGQIDLGSLKEFLLRQNSESLSGSATNITGFYPYGDNPSGYASSGYVTGISGDISGYITTTSGILRTDLSKTGLDLSGYVGSVSSELASDIDEVSGDLRYISGLYSAVNTLTTGNEDDIDSISGALYNSGQNLSVLITGETGNGLSGYVTGHVHDTSGILDAKITSLNTSLRSHAAEDYISKRDEAEVVSGSVSFLKKLKLTRGLEHERVGDRDEISTSQSGVNMYSHVSGTTIGSAYHEVLTTYLRHPQSGDNARQDVILSTFQYSGGIPA